MTLEMRLSVVGSVLEAVLGTDGAAVVVSVDSEGTVMLHLDSDEIAFGFVDAGIPESVGEAAVRLAQAVADELPESRRWWGRQEPACTVPGHRHPMVPRSDDDRTLGLFCPEVPDVARAVVVLPTST